MSPTLAIDFGSSRTKIAFLCPDSGEPKIIELGQEIRAVMPSVFYIPQSGSVLVGDEAVQMADEDPAGIVMDIKRELQRPGKIRCGEGRTAYLRSELVAILFTEIRRRCDEEVFHNGSIDSCTLTVPVCFSEPQRQKLRQAAEHAGFTHVTLLEEPIAAAMHWLSGSGKSVSDHVIVVDIGGGTTDLAALKLCDNSYEVIPDLPPCGFAAGGNDIDEDLRRVIAKDGGCSDEEAGALLMKLRQVKERMTKMDRDVFTINLAGRTRTIPRNVVELAVQSLVAKTCAEASRFLNDFREVTGRTDTPVLLAGGGSKLAGMREALAEVAGEDRVFIWNDAEYAIVLGAVLAGVQNRKSSPPPMPSSLDFTTQLDPSTISNSSESANLVSQLEAILTKPYSTVKQRTLITLDMVNSCELEANHGNPMAQALIGFCYEDGFQVTKNPDHALFWYQKSVNQKNAFGQAFLGGYFLEGKGVPTNEVEAVKWYRLSADQGNYIGQAMLGFCYQSGKGVPKDEAEAINWFQLAAKQGQSLGQAMLGMCYHTGKGVQVDESEAVRYYQLSANQEDPFGQYFLGICYLNGTCVPQNYSEAVKFFRLSADQGNVDAQNLLGCRYLDGTGVTENHVEAAKWFQLAADQGNTTAQNNFGLCYLSGRGVPKNHTEAVKWFRLAADQGDSDGQCYLGLRYCNGEGVPTNFEEGVKWFRLAAAQGDADAQNNLGFMYFDGDGVLQNYAEAVKWFQMSADQGNAQGQNLLACRYLDGSGVSQDYAKALKWLFLAADQGCTEAQNNLGLCYFNGNGVAQSHTQAVKWFRLSADQGDPDGLNYLGCRYLDGTGVPINQDEALRLFRLSADQGNEVAQQNIKNVLSTSHDFQKDLNDIKQGWSEIKLGLKKFWSGS